MEPNYINPKLHSYIEFFEELGSVKINKASFVKPNIAISIPEDWELPEGALHSFSVHSFLHNSIAFNDYRVAKIVKKIIEKYLIFNEKFYLLWVDPLEFEGVYYGVNFKFNDGIMQRIDFYETNYYFMKLSILTSEKHFHKGGKLIGLLGINNFNAGLLCTMILMGIPFKDCLRFLSFDEIKMIFKKRASSKNTIKGRNERYLNIFKCVDFYVNNSNDKIKIYYLEKLKEIYKIYTQIYKYHKFAQLGNELHRIYKIEQYEELKDWYNSLGKEGIFHYNKSNPKSNYFFIQKKRLGLPNELFKLE